MMIIYFLPVVKLLIMSLHTSSWCSSCGLSPSLEPISLSPDSTSFANSAEHIKDVEQAFPGAYYHVWQVTVNQHITESQTRPQQKALDNLKDIQSASRRSFPL
jgi:hypothetical protein